MNDELFRKVAPPYMSQFMADFGCTKIDAAAVFGNAGHESLGFTALQEFRPAVSGSRGGWGWFQWTGPRRRAFEAYCKRNKKDPASHDANYAWLFVELTGPEKHAITQLKAAVGLVAKVEAFERAYERAGVKHYDRRLKWAEVALDAFDKAQPPDPVPSPPPDKPSISTPAAGSIGAAIVALLVVIAKALGFI